MRRSTFVLALVAFVAVASLTVHLQVRASRRAYQLARELERDRQIREQIEIRRFRIERSLSPDKVYGRVLRHDVIASGVEGVGSA